jgi:hypothetical protein
MPETMLVLARDLKADVLTRLFDEAVVCGKLDLKAMSATIDREFGRRTPGTTFASAFDLVQAAGRAVEVGYLSRAAAGDDPPRSTDARMDP